MCAPRRQDLRPKVSEAVVLHVSRREVEAGDLPGHQRSGRKVQPEVTARPVLGPALLASMYTAFQQIDPTMDTGVNFSAEYKATTEMQKA
jgi:hypothetical protein